MSDGRLLNIGKVVNTHGIKGELKIWPQTDFPEVRFKPGNKLMMFPPESGDPITVEIVSSREQKKMYVVKIKGFDNINQVEKYKGWEIEGFRRRTRAVRRRRILRARYRGLRGRDRRWRNTRYRRGYFVAGRERYMGRENAERQGAALAGYRRRRTGRRRIRP